MTAALRPSPDGAAAAEATSGWRGARQNLDQIAIELGGAGIDDAVERLEQIAQLLYLKRLDDREKPGSDSRIFRGPMTSRFRWSRLCTLHGEELRRSVEDALFYLSSLVNEAPAVADYFRDPMLRIENPGILERIVDQINQIDFTRLKPDEMGRILEYLIAETNPGVEFRTPHHVRALMVTLVDPQEKESVYDPACGTGGFLTDAVTYVLAKLSSAPREMSIYGEDWSIERSPHRLQTWREEGGSLYPRAGLGRRIFGHDISRRMIRIAAMNLDLQDIGQVNLRRTNSLTASGAGLTPEELSRKFDVILCAPTFGNAPPGEPVRPDLPIHSMRSEVLFVEVAMQGLAPAGRAAIVVPDSLLTASGTTFVELRKRLLFDRELLAVVSLPLGVFRSQSAVKTSILILRRSESGKRATARVWFYEVRHDGFDLERREQPEVNDIPDLLEAWEQYKASGYTKPPGLSTGSVYEKAEVARCWWADLETIEKNGFDLAVDSYRPRQDTMALFTIEEQSTRFTEARAQLTADASLFERSLRVLPRDWNQSGPRVRLSNMVELISGTTPRRDNPLFWGGSIPWASPKDMKPSILEATEEQVTQRAVEESSLRVVPPGSLMIVVRSMVLVHRVPMAVSNVPLTLNQDLRALVLRPDSRIDVWYLFAYLRSVEDILLARTRVTGNGGRALSQQILLDLEVPIPPSDVIHEIGKFVRRSLELTGTTERFLKSVTDIFPAVLADVFGPR